MPNTGGDGKTDGMREAARCFLARKAKPRGFRLRGFFYDLIWLRGLATNSPEIFVTLRKTRISAAFKEGEV